MATTSQWRVESRKVIAKAVEGTEGKTRKEVQKVISAAYPFGRRQYLPYKMWLAEVKAYLNRRFGVPEAVVRVDPRFGVYCPVCRAYPAGFACLVCQGVRARWAEFERLHPRKADQWALLVQDALRNESVALILADWVEDEGFPEEADALRSMGVHMAKKPRDEVGNS